MPIQSTGEIIGNEITDAVAEFYGCVTPIFAVNEKREPMLFGSAVLIAVANEVYLCTAKHVIDGNAVSSLYVDGTVQLEIFEGEFYCSTEHDVAVAKLTPVQVKTLRKYVPLGTDDIAAQLETLASKYVAFIGYPETKNRPVYRRNQIARHMQLNGCKPLQITETRVRLSFNQKRNIDRKSRQRVTAPDPYGMSGGAMFGASIYRAAIAGKPRPKLIGISTDKPNANEVFGTNIVIVMSIIRDGWGSVLPTRLNPSHIRATSTPTHALTQSGPRQ